VRITPEGSPPGAHLAGSGNCERWRVSPLLPTDLSALAQLHARARAWQRSGCGDGGTLVCVGVLREVVEADLPVFYEHQRDREAAAMAAFPARERDAFMAHWAKTLANDSALTWTVVSDGAVAGNIGCWEDDGRRLVGYWIGREFWGRGLATRALAELLDVVDARPLHAYVAKSNVASIRVLEKCGFVTVGEHAGDDGIEELLLELRA
jgi:RimJ/RimL family protein N-acetyltransferase